MTWKCPQCGEVNKESLLLCGLCGERRPEEKPQEVVARVMGAPPVVAYVPPPVVQPQPPQQAWNPPPGAAPGWNVPAGSAQLSPEEKRRLAEEEATRILGRSPNAPVNSSGCATTVMFVCLLPWSLILLPMPGGVKNKNAGKILGIIFVVCLVLAIISVVAAIPMVMKYVPQLKNAYTVPGE